MVDKKQKWDWIKFLTGMKRPIISMIGAGLTAIAVGLTNNPEWSWLGAAIGGISAERIYSTIMYYVGK